MYSKNFEVNAARATHRQIPITNEVHNFVIDVPNHKFGQSHQQTQSQYQVLPEHTLQRQQQPQPQQQHSHLHATELTQSYPEHSAQPTRQQASSQHQPTTKHQQRKTQAITSHSTLFNKIDVTKSTKGASKLRRDLINAEIANLRDLLPLPQSTRQRLSQLQLMALVCVYVRKANYFQQVFSRPDAASQQNFSPNIGFSKALSGFLMMLTQNGKLLYISDNATEYLGHSMEDLLIHGDSVYDIIDKLDHPVVQTELNRNANQNPQDVNMSAPAVANVNGDHRIFLCRMNVTRNARRQMRFGDQKVVLIQGRYLSFLPLCNRNEPVFLATCTPIAMPETRECVVQGATNIFTTIHTMDMKIMHIDENGEFHLGYSRNEIQGTSWYALLHGDNLREAQCKHRLLVQSEQDRSCILLVRLQRNSSEFIWVHTVLYVRDAQDSNQQPLIVCTNQVLNECEASVMRINSWLYQFYSMQSKIQFALSYENNQIMPATAAIGNSPPLYYHNLQHATPSGKRLIECPDIRQNVIQTPAFAETMHVHPYSINNLPADNTHYSLMRISDLTTTNSGLLNETKLVRIEDSLCRSKNASFQSQLPAAESHSASKFYLQTKMFQEPVDYSQLNDTQQTTYPASSNKSSEIDSLCESTSSSASSPTSGTNKCLQENNFTCNNCVRSSLLKRKTNDKLNPIHAQPTQPAGHSINDMDRYQCHSNQTISLSHGSHSSVIVATLLPARSCSGSHLLNKMLSTDPKEFIDQGNPSPPWSDSAQKFSIDCSSIAQPEVRSCITTAGLTANNGQLKAKPSCAAGYQTHGSAFSFEWMPEHLMSVVDACVAHQVSDPYAHTHSHSHYTQCTPTWTAHVISPNHYNHLTQRYPSSSADSVQNESQKARASAALQSFSDDEYKKEDNP